MEWLQFSIIVLTIGSFLWMVRRDHRHLLHTIDLSIKEIQDFHGKLEKQDAELKAAMIRIEERRNKIIFTE